MFYIYYLLSKIFNSIKSAGFSLRFNHSQMITAADILVPKTQLDAILS